VALTFGLIEKTKMVRTYRRDEYGVAAVCDRGAPKVHQALKASVPLTLGLVEKPQCLLI